MRSFRFSIIIIKLVYRYSGIEFIASKARYYQSPPNEKLPTFTIWVIGIYFAAYGIASQLYESKLDLIENRTNIVIALCGTDNYRSALEQIPSIQNMKTPWEPSIVNPISIIKSLFGKQFVSKDYFESCIKTDQQLRRVLITFIDKTKFYKDPQHLKLSNNDRIDLNGLNLSEIDLSPVVIKGGKTSIHRHTVFLGINLQKAMLWFSKLNNVYFLDSDLSYTDFAHSDLRNAVFNGSKLFNSNFSNAVLSGSKFRGVKLLGTNFRGAIIKGADFSGAIHWSGKKCMEGSIGSCMIKEESTGNIVNYKLN